MFLFIKIFTAFQLLFGAVYTNQYYHSPPKIYSHQNYLAPEATSLVWSDNITYGNSATEPAREIYQDDHTKLIGKLVIPWLLHYTNQYRKEQGLDTLLHDPCLLKAAGYQTDYLFNESKKAGQFKLGHSQDVESPWFKGRDPKERALTAGCVKYCGENALYAHLVPVPADDFNYQKKLNLAAQKIAKDMVFNQWHRSKGHRENMLTKGYTNMGVSVAIGKNYSDNSSTSDQEANAEIKDGLAAGWIAFGVQVMAY